MDLEIAVTLLLGVLVNAMVVSATWTEKIKSSRWGGVGIYIAVDKAKVQAKLDKYHENNPGAPRLYVPETPVFPEIEIRKDQHLVYIDFGVASSPDFADMSPNDFKQAMSDVLISMLATSPGGPPEYDLALVQMIPADLGDIPIDHILFPNRTVDSLHVAEGGASVRDGDEAIHVTFDIPKPCLEPPPFIRSEFEGTILRTSQLPFSAPDLGFCERHPSIAASSPFCSRLGRIRSDVDRNLPNVCSHYAIDSGSACRANITSISVSPKFRELLLLDPDQTIDIISAEEFYGNYTVGLNYPCVEMSQG